MRKPPSVKAREHITRVNEINSYLPLFPDVRDGVVATSIPEDELKDILDYGNPARWQQ